MLSIGPVTIFWYGFFVTLGVVLGILIFLWLARRYGFNKDLSYNLVFYILIFGFIGDRLMHVLMEIGYYIDNPLDIFKVWQGGLAIHGAIIAGLLVILLYSRRGDLGFSGLWSKRFWVLADIGVVAIIIGQTIGRWGNYFNQELYGLPTELSFGIPISLANRVAGYGNFEFFHPTFLYQMILNAIIFIILLVWHLRRIKTVRQSSDQSISGGQILIAYLFLYGAARFLVEILRIDSQPTALGLRYGQWASIGLVLAAIILIIIRMRVSRTTNSKERSY